jgi:hypothetical protein
VIEFSDDRVDGFDPGPCPRCGALPLQIEISERKHVNADDGGRIR